MFAQQWNHLKTLFSGALNWAAHDCNLKLPLPFCHMRTRHDPGGRAERESNIPKNSVVQDFKLPTYNTIASWGSEPNEEHDSQHSCSSPNSRKSDCISPELRFSTRKSDEIVLGILVCKVCINPPTNIITISSKSCISDNQWKKPSPTKVPIVVIPDSVLIGVQDTESSVLCPHILHDTEDSPEVKVKLFLGLNHEELHSSN